jgi:methyltransferase (TIGR00027 family)
MNKLIDTARLVAMYRALESDRPDALFQDPLAQILAGGQGRMLAAVMGEQQSVNAIAVRTRVIDDLIQRAIATQKIDTVLNLAAGLDTRPYRLPLPSQLQWIEVDFPELLLPKEIQLRDYQPNCQLQQIGLDLADLEARQQLFSRVSQQTEGCLVISEGFLGYLTESQVAKIAFELNQHSNLSHWIFELVTISPLFQVRQSEQIFHQLFGEEAGKLAYQFFPANGTQFFEPYGWQVLESRSFWQDLIRLDRISRVHRSWGAIGSCVSRRYRRMLHEGAKIVLLQQRPVW